MKEIQNVCGRFRKPEILDVAIEVFRRLENKGII